MKQLLFVFVLISSTALAQENLELKNKWLVGGNANIYVERVGGNTGRFVAQVQPQAGYMLSNRWAIGTRMPASFLSNEWNVGLSPFVRYYLPIKGQALPFIELNGGYSWRGIKDVALDTYLVEQSWLFGSCAGMAFFVTNYVSFDMFFYYTGMMSKTKLPGTGIFTQPINKAEMGIGLGFQIFL